jgi:hypothetical protein
MDFSLRKLGYPGRGRRDTREAVHDAGREAERVFEGLEEALLKFKIRDDGDEGVEVSSMDARMGSAGSGS